MSWKIGEWREGKRIDVDIPQPFGLVVGKITTRLDGGGATTETLFAFHKYGQKDDLMSAWDSGFTKGEKAGYAKAQADIRRLLGIKLEP